MSKKNVCTVIALIFLLHTMLLFKTEKVKAESPAEVCVDPSIVTITPDENFTVNIKVDKVKNLYAYQFKLNWEPSLLEVINITEGPFLDSEGTYETYFVPKIYNEPDPMGVSGYINVACTLLGEPAIAAASGNGTLATLEFLAKEEGNTSLHLYDTILLNALLIEIPHTIKAGYSIIIPEFPATLILPLSMILPLIIVILNKKRKFERTKINS